MISLNKDMPVFPGRAGVSERRPIHDPTAFEVEEWIFEPGVKFNGHAHGQSVMTYIVKGRMRLKQSGEEVELEAGCYYFTPPGMVHEIAEIIETTTMLCISSPKKKKK